MSTQILNFMKQEVVMESREAVESYVVDTFGHYAGDATQAYKNWKEKQTGAITDRALKEFMLGYLSKKTKNAPGSAFVICMDPAVKDTRERPYTIIDIKNEEGKRKYKKVYQLIDEATGVVLGEVSTNKADAKNLSKEIIKNGFKGKMVCNLAHKVVEGQETVFTAEYTPSKNTKNGTWVVFGIGA